MHIQEGESFRKENGAEFKEKAKLSSERTNKKKRMLTSVRDV